MTDEEAAKAYASGTVFVDETGNDEALIYNMRAMAFLAGVEHGRKQIEQRERMAWHAARAKIHTTERGFHLKYTFIEDWKKEQEG